MNPLLASDSPYIVKAPLMPRIRCVLLHGGHSYYFNGELGDLWCYNCQSVRKIKAEGWSRG